MTDDNVFLISRFLNELVLLMHFVSKFEHLLLVHIDDLITEENVAVSFTLVSVVDQRTWLNHVLQIH